MSQDKSKIELQRARVLRGALELKPKHHVVPKVFKDFTPDGLEQLRRVLRAGIERAKAGGK